MDQPPEDPSNWQAALAQLVEHCAEARAHRVRADGLTCPGCGVVNTLAVQLIDLLEPPGLAICRRCERAFVPLRKAG